LNNSANSTGRSLSALADWSSKPTSKCSNNLLACHQPGQPLNAFVSGDSDINEDIHRCRIKELPRGLASCRTRAESALGFYLKSVPWCACPIITPDLGRLLLPNSEEKNLLTKREHRPFCKLIQSTLTLWTKQEVSAFDRRKKMLPREAYWILFKSKSWKQPKWLIYFSIFKSGGRYKFRTCDPCSVKTPTFY
jgi:hypothetical protein